MRLHNLLASLAMIGVLAAPAASPAQNAMSHGDASIDCKNVSEMLHQAMQPASATMTNNVDTDTMHAMMVQTKATMQIAKIEMACGSNTKMKAMAKKAHDDALELFNEFHRAGTEE